MAAQGPPSDYGRALTWASQRLGIELRRRTSTKAVGPCPICHGDDRFVVWLFEGSGWCSRCGHVAYLIDREDAREAKAQAVKRRAEQQRELRARMATITVWQQYHADLLRTSDLHQLWLDEGITLHDIGKWGLGYCQSCPVASEYASLTMPVFQDEVLVDIRHKLLGAPEEEQGKYRSHLPGLIPAVFNSGAIYNSRELVLVEGEKKAIVMCRYGWDGTMGIPGMGVAEELIDLLAERMEPLQVLTILLDPGADRAAERIAEQVLGLGRAAVLADSPIKPDDFLLRYGRDAMRVVMAQTRRC